MEIKPPQGREGRRKAQEANTSEVTKPMSSSTRDKKDPPLQDASHKGDDVVGEMAPWAEQQEPERARKSSGTD